MITPENTLAHELIGLRVEVIKSPHRGYIGLAGQIVDETRQTLVIRTKGRELRIPKEHSTFRFFFEEGSVDIDGDLLVSRPEDRIKKFWRKKYGKLWRQKLPFSR